MAKCPNCEAQLAWDALECQGCRAVFSPGSAWAPVGESREEKQKLRERYPAANADATPRDPSNLYAPPQAAVEDADPDQGRPFWVWAITIFYGLGLLWSLLSTVLIATNAIPVDGPSRTYWDNLTPFDHALSVANALISLCGIVLLFLMRARAVALMLAGLVISVLGTLYHFAAKEFAATLGGSGIAGLLFGFVLWIVVIWYAHRLRTAGRLR
jgi:hypothetical protein